eukprot:8869083-Pyramimonas_sp.AAC.1
MSCRFAWGVLGAGNPDVVLAGRVPFRGSRKSADETRACQVKRSAMLPDTSARVQWRARMQQHAQHFNRDTLRWATLT